MHPEMVARYGYPPPPYEIPRPAPTADELAAAAAKEEALQEAVRQAVPIVRRLFDEFVLGMEAVPKIPIADPKTGLVEVKRWGYAPAFRRRGAPVGAGWFVATRHLGLPRSSSSSRGSCVESTEAVGLAVTSDGEVFEATPPNCFEMETRGSNNIATSLAALALHTHHIQLWDADMAAEMVDVLAELLDQTASDPVRLPPRSTKRQARELDRRIEDYRDEKIFGPGGFKSYRKRMYGK